MTEIRVNATIGDRQLAEFAFTYIEGWGWSARVALDARVGLQMYQRPIRFMPENENVLVLIKEVLDQLPEEAFHATGFPPDMARRQPRALPAVQAWARKLRHH